MTGQTFILAVVVIALGLLWVRINGSAGLLREPVRLQVRIDDEPPVQRIPVKIQANSYWR